MKLQQNQRSSDGIFLIDCLVYIGLLAVLLGCAFMAFYTVIDHSRHLSQNAADIVRALNAGECWRKDVRAATGPPELVEEDRVATLFLPQAGGKIRYTWRDGMVYRWSDAKTNEGWQVFLPDVKSSRMERTSHAHVSAWRWEIELATRQPTTRVRPLFTFQAAVKSQPHL